MAIATKHEKAISNLLFGACLLNFLFIVWGEVGVRHDTTVVISKPGEITVAPDGGDVQHLQSAGTEITLIKPVPPTYYQTLKVITTVGNALALVASIFMLVQHYKRKATPAPSVEVNGATPATDR